jgi:hypothetical protein
MLSGAYEGPKIFWLWIGGFTLWIVWMIRLLLFHPFSVTKNGKWFLLWLFVLGVAGVVGIHPIDSLVGGNPQYQGLLFFFILFLIGETVHIVSAYHRPLLRMLLGFGVIVESVIVLQQKIFDLTNHPVGTLGEPDAVAGFLALGLLWVATFPHMNVWLRKVVYFLTLVAIVVTDSKIVMIVALLISIGLGVRALQKVTNKTIRLLLISMGIITIAISCMYLFSLIQYSNPIPPYDNRAVFWKFGMGEFVKRPLLGYGLGSTDIIYENAFKTIGVYLYQLMIDRSHSLPLDILLWSGGIGLFTFGVWLYHEIKSFVSIREYPILIGIAAWMVFAFFQPVGIVHWILFIVLLRLSLYEKASKKSI